MKLDVDLAYASISQIGKLYRQRKLSPVELTKVLFDRIDLLNPKLNAYLTLNREGSPVRRRGSDFPQASRRHHPWQNKPA